jgi:hypothetical protein
MTAITSPHGRFRHAIEQGRASRGLVLTASCIAQTPYTPGLAARDQHERIAAEMERFGQPADGDI